MRKSIREFHKGELIHICGWQEVKGNPEPYHSGKYFTLWIQIVGLQLPTLFAFENDEEFEYKPGMPRIEEAV